jgi:hypothetical protein
MKQIATTQPVQRINRALPKKGIPLVLLALLLSVTALSAGAAPSAIEMQRHVIAGGGGHSEANGLTLNGTVGQVVVGVTNQGTYDFCSGFWCGMGRYTIHLPLVLRN